MHGAGLDRRSQAREAYFLDLARDIVAAAPMPIMRTGGVRTRAGACEVLATGVAMVGVATALAQRPSLPLDWAQGRPGPPPIPSSSSADKMTAAAAKQAAVRWILRRTAARGSAAEVTDPDAALQVDKRRRAQLLPRYRSWLAACVVSAPSAASTPAF